MLFHRRRCGRKERCLIWAVGGLFALTFLVGGYLLMDGLVRGVVDATAISPAATRPAPPTQGEYEPAAAAAMVPVFASLAAPSDPSAPGDSGLAEAAASAQQELIALRVPTADKDCHLQAVLVLDAWLAVGRGETSAERAEEMTDGLKRDCPFLVVPQAP